MFSRNEKTEEKKLHSFAYKYSESIMREALGTKLENSLPVHYTLGSILAPLGYVTPHALVLDPASDNSKTTLLQTIEHIFTDLKDEYQSNPQVIQTLLQKERILLPVAEGCKILGLFPRMHWVTLCYEPEKNCATLIDSRPRLFSFLYNTEAMKASLKKGIASVFGEKKAHEMRFETRYQGVQHNDIHCGAWTARNIIDLATQDISLKKQLTRYRSSDEAQVMQSNCPPGKKIIPRPLNWFSRLLVYLGFKTQGYNLLDSRPSPYTSKLSSLMSSGQTTPRQYSPQKHSSPASRRSSRIFNNVEVIDEYIVNQHSEHTQLQKK
ncbi:MAG: hypothetical protein BGO90_10370 [Legionella sp. 40-6]|nr:hypothetical protein [Legionella sp.]OJY47187.1 MAG: hypothetical protein BGO90_10370 [Legionella sp. 40-6]